MRHVLVVDDELPLLRILTMHLSRHGYNVSAAATGAAALQIVTVDHPDVIILDLGLPDIDGTEVIRTLRNRGHRVPIIVISARDTSHDKAKALDLGANDYLTKPFDISKLVARIDAVTCAPKLSRP